MNSRTTDSPIEILLVEDDDGCALLLQTILTRWRYGGFNIRRAGTLSEAIQAVAQGGFDLVLLDLGLPDSWGLDTFVRMHAAATRVPIIVLSGLDDVELATATVQQGAQDFVVKGQEDGASLVRTIRYAIERFRAQQALAGEHDLLRSLIDNIPDQVYLKDTESRFVSVNPVTARFFGATSPDQLVGKCDFDFFPPELAAQFMEEEQALLHNDQPCINREASVADAAGNTRWILTTKVPLRDHTGQITGLLGINRDITERKQAEEALHRMNAELEQRVSERTDALRAAVARLEDQDRARVAFVSCVSHDLRAPLTTMKIEIANLLAGVLGPLPDALSDYLRMMDMDCQRMTNTVEDILDLSRLESRTMHLHRSRILFDRLTRQAVTALGVQAQAKRMLLVPSLDRDPVFVACDAGKMMRAIINILGNAIKFSPEGGRVDIALHRNPASAGTVVLEITDNGIGIAAPNLERVTEKYYRVSEQVSGTGLGLSIAKEIIELHGGALAIQSPPPGMARGTRVSVCMPIAAPPTVMIVHQDEDARTLLDQRLSSRQYRVIICPGSEDALSFARSTRPDVVIFDFPATADEEKSPVYSMKADADLRGIPMVAIACAGTSQDRLGILNGLGIPTLPASWHEEELLDCVETAIRDCPPA
jgi:PAS domain S-box-containing protein